MLNSKERINFISKYISAYRSQIELSNSRGLFDSAKLFETFACELCNLWFGKKFNNLNEEIPNFPYFDLVSKDGELFVQVSTAKDIPTKIKSTLWHQNTVCAESADILCRRLICDLEGYQYWRASDVYQLYGLYGIFS